MEHTHIEEHHKEPLLGKLLLKTVKTFTVMVHTYKEGHLKELSSWVNSCLNLQKTLIVMEHTYKDGSSKGASLGQAPVLKP
jgi:hypothetical protein